MQGDIRQRAPESQPSPGANPADGRLKPEQRTAGSNTYHHIVPIDNLSHRRVPGAFLSFFVTAVELPFGAIVDYAM
jgi:hypothetical protein